MDTTDDQPSKVISGCAGGYHVLLIDTVNNIPIITGNGRNNNGQLGRNYFSPFLYFNRRERIREIMTPIVNLQKVDCMDDHNLVLANNKAYSFEKMQMDN